MRLALTLTVTYAVFFSATSQVDIDYSHSVAGTGTLITDYRMGDKQTSEASGKVRGTGNVMNKYLFWTENDSQNVTIEDQFSLSGKAAVTPAYLNFSSFPPGPDFPDGFRLTGATWADGLVMLGSISNSSADNSSSSRAIV
jgi:hypothetical protein